MGKLFDALGINGGGNYFIDPTVYRFRKVTAKSWINYYKKYCHKKAIMKGPDSLVSNLGEEVGMSIQSRNAKIIRYLQQGKTLRAIGDAIGVDNKTVYRVGAKVGVFSVRSAKLASARKKNIK